MSKNSQENDPLHESWVEVDGEKNGTNGNGGMIRVSSIHNGDMEKLLIEAQRESNQSSAHASTHTSHGNTPHGVRSPHNGGSPNALPSPSSELAHSDFTTISAKLQEEDLKSDTDWIWDWSSRPDNMPPKQWIFRRPIKKQSLSIRNTKAMKSKLSDILPVLIFSNLMSLVLGAGIGWYFARKLTARPLSITLLPVD